MPIVGNGENVHVEYSIPEEIKKKIPEEFYYAMGGELCAIGGPKIFEKFEEDYYDLNSSTAGWVEAFKETCRKLDMKWLVDYWYTLEWYDSDIFDGEIEMEIIKRFCEKNMPSANPYYGYLIRKSDKEKQENIKNT